MSTAPHRPRGHVSPEPSVKILLLFFVLSVMPVTASLEGSGAVQAGLILTVQPPGVANHRMTPPITGKALGMTVAAGALVSPTFSVEGEFVVGGTVATPQHFSCSWGEDYTAEVRDLLLNGNVRWRAFRHLELIGGGGLALSTFASRSIVRTDLFPTPRTTTLPDQVTTSRRPTLGGASRHRSR